MAVRPSPLSVNCRLVNTHAFPEEWHFLQLIDQSVNLGKKCLAAHMRTTSDQVRCVVGEYGIASVTGPTTHFAIGEKCETAQVISSSGVPKVCEQIFESQLQARSRGHVAVQHEIRN